MRVYKFLSVKWALDDIEKGRLKIATFDDLNDPFELWPVDLSDRKVRFAFEKLKEEIAPRFGFLSFSRIWKEPLLWGHYADNHKGICLGFDLRGDESSGGKIFEKVTYLSTLIRNYGDVFSG